MDLSAIASVGSAVALVIFLLVGIAGWRRRKDTGSNPAIIVLALLITATVLAFFAVDTLENAPETFVAIIAHRGAGGGVRRARTARPAGRTIPELIAWSRNGCRSSTGCLVTRRELAAR